MIGSHNFIVLILYSISFSVKTILFIRSVESVVTDDMVSTTDGKTVCMPPFHTDVWEMKPSTQQHLPQGLACLAFVSPRKHTGLGSEQLPIEKQRQENLKTFMKGAHEQILRRRDLNICLLYKSHKLLPVSCTCTSRSRYVSTLVFTCVFISGTLNTFQKMEKQNNLRIYPFHMPTAP